MAKGDTFVAPEADQADGCPHPREVYDLIGHRSAEQLFAKQFADNKLHHAWLINGPKGIGKATLAYRMIRTVLGGKPNTPRHLDVPPEDQKAQRIQSLGHGDFLLIRRPYDEKTKKLRTEIPIAETRKISSFFSRKASEGGWRVCLIDSIDEMNRNATNAVLKTLEEPPEKALIILISKAPGRLLPTIRSRCLNLPLRPVPPDELQSWLDTKCDADATDIAAAVHLAKGAPGKALSLIQNAETVLRPLQRFLDGFPKDNLRTLHSISDALAAPSAVVSYDLFWDSLDELIGAQAIYAATGEWRSAYGPITLQKSPENWIQLKNDLNDMRMAQAGLNMNKKTVILNALSQFGAA
ncbi:MAG: DNA polymerase III subunit delta' [Acidimicrobiales bacterium]|nr:DNA polymerase III subunit delta' [Hyphomonadaceae bacterium]RZV42790.1 MAG: DNA polymerase III subunit delta' [Acidimicrobiales bacterium]